MAKREPEPDPRLAARNQKLNVLFALASIALLATVAVMVWADYDREWRQYQVEFNRLRVELTQAQIEEALSPEDAERLAEIGIEPSVGSVGDSYDNALAETINGLYKTEVIHPNGPWKNVDEVEFATLEWVDWFNHRRLLEPLGGMPPSEYEALYEERTLSSTMGVGLN